MYFNAFVEIPEMVSLTLIQNLVCVCVCVFSARKLFK